VVSKQELRSEETKASILAAAGNLFSTRGYDAVTMREIAKEAGCSHTTIYIYFKDKETLLQQLSMGPLHALKQKMEQIQSQGISAENKLKQVSLEFIEFCLTHRNMHTIFLNVKSVRVDEKEPELEMNKLRNALFAQLMTVLQECLQIGESNEQLLMYTRIYFFTLNGIVLTYMLSEETVDRLMDRLATTFNEAVEVLLIGFRHQLET
jgi:AcrR family transcriptional regulator